jgi:hypothetical protein
MVINAKAQRRKELGLTQIKDLLLFVGYFCPRRGKNNLQKKKSTRLPQARIAFT